MNSEAGARVLMLDTSADTGTVALVVAGSLRVAKRMKRARDYAAVLNETVAEVLEEAGVELKELTAIGVLAGPGSYTGLRISLAAAKGWCYALEIPMFLQNGLQILADEARAGYPGYSAYISVLPARQGEYFFAAYSAAGGALVEPRHLKLSDALEVLGDFPDQCVVIGSEIAAAEVFSSEKFSAEALQIIARDLPSVEAWMKTALAQIHAGDAADLAYAEPFYLKAAYTTTPKASR